MRASCEVSVRARARPLALAALAGLAMAMAAPERTHAATACAGAAVQPPELTRELAAAAVTCLLNQERRRRDLPRLRAVPRLERAAGRHARDMVQRRFFAHTTPDGSSMSDRLRDVGYIDDARSWAVGEALAWGTGSRATPAGIVAAWLDSPPHRRVLLSPAYRDLGIGMTLGVPVGKFAGLPGATYAAELGARS